MKLKTYRYFDDKYCPIRDGACYEMCEWCYINVELTEDGINEKINCAINVIAEALCEMDLIGE